MAHMIRRVLAGKKRKQGAGRTVSQAGRFATGAGKAANIRGLMAGRKKKKKTGAVHPLLRRR